MPISGRLYLVATPRPHSTEREFLARISAALDGGVDVLQLRCKDLEAVPYLRLAERTAALARDAEVPFIVNDRVDIAAACGAGGVHLGVDDLPSEWARRLAPGLMLGRSSHELSQANAALRSGADYIAVGPVWETPTKPGRPAAGLDYVRAVAALGVGVPWFAIGGITLENLSQVLDAGATRVAVVRSVLDASDPARAARAFREALDSARAGAGQEVPAWS